MCLTLTLTLTQARTPKLIKYGMGSIILVPTKLSDPTQWAGFRYLDPANIENKTRNTHTHNFFLTDTCVMHPLTQQDFLFFFFLFAISTCVVPWVYRFTKLCLMIGRYRCVHPTSTATSYQWGWCSRKWGSVCDCLYLVPVVVDLPLSLYNDRQ